MSKKQKENKKRKEIQKKENTRKKKSQEKKDEKTCEWWQQRTNGKLKNTKCTTTKSFTVQLLQPRPSKHIFMYIFDA